MRKHQKTIVFGFTALFMCSLLVFIVWMQTFIFYRYTHWIVEPVLLFAVAVLSVVGSYLVVAPDSMASSAVAAIVPIIVFAITTKMFVSHNLSLQSIAIVAIMTATTAGWTVRFIYRHNVKSGLQRVLLGWLFIATSIILIAIVNIMFVYDFTERSMP